MTFGFGYMPRLFDLGTSTTQGERSVITNDKNVQPGDKIVLRSGERSYERTREDWTRVDLAGGTVMTVIETYARSVWARTEDNTETVKVRNDHFDPMDTNDERHKKLAYRVPEGMLSPLDERLSWFWDELEKHPSVRHQCSTYDQITNEVGLPGRRRDFNVNAEVSPGVSISVTVKARSQEEANDVASRLTLTEKCTENNDSGA